MKTVHILKAYGGSTAMCGYSILGFLSNSPKGGTAHIEWCSVDFMATYVYPDTPFAFCEDCLASSEYGLYLLGEIA